MKRSEAVQKLYVIIRNGLASSQDPKIAYSNILEDIEKEIGMLPPPKITYKFRFELEDFEWETEDESE